METFSALLALCEGKPPVTGGFPSQRPVTRRFDVFFDLRLNKRFSKQWRSRWFDTPSRSSWRHCNAVFIWFVKLALLAVIGHLQRLKLMITHFYPLSYTHCILDNLIDKPLSYTQWCYHTDCQSHWTLPVLYVFQPTAVSMICHDPPQVVIYNRLVIGTDSTKMAHKIVLQHNDVDYSTSLHDTPNTGK